MTRPSAQTAGHLVAAKRLFDRMALVRGRGDNISNNQITNTAFIGTVGLDGQCAGIAPIHAAGASDLVLRNIDTGAFEVYDIANNQLTGAASTTWWFCTGTQTGWRKLFPAANASWRS